MQIAVLNAPLPTEPATPSMPTPDQIAAMRLESRFRQAVAAIAADNLRYYQRRWLGNRVLNDRGRFGIALICMYLHFSYRPNEPSSGLTAARLREICVGAGLCGGGRVEGILLMMRATGFLERAEDRVRGVRRYVPTSRLVRLHRERNRQLLLALDCVRGDTRFAERIGDDLDDPFYPRFVSAMAAMFLAGYRMVNAAPELQRMLDRDAGLPLMFCALLAGPDYADLVPEEMRPVTVADLARRFSVSGIHVRSVQRDAESARLIIRHGDMTRVTVLPALTDAMENFFASALVMIESCARAAAAQEE
ncbi:MAG: hypothetical protein GC182_09270 [Rhodopseudomonas sp.]|nr:hypothetical protein [Rhodopseudomonas sp.]